jgi:hypothetical protein
MKPSNLAIHPRAPGEVAPKAPYFHRASPPIGANPQAARRKPILERIGFLHLLGLSGNPAGGIRWHLDGTLVRLAIFG